MRTTSIRLSKGFWGRSYDELKRLSGIALRSEGIKGPSGPYELQSFHDPSSLADCKLMTDAEIGGFSTAALDWVPASSAAPSAAASATTTTTTTTTSTPAGGGYIRFHGTISTRLPADRPDVQRTGYAAWRTADRRPTVFGRALWDVDSYAYLALRVRSDGRSYLVNVQTDSMVAPTDLHQHRLFARRPGQWETVVVPWAEFVRTNHGFVVEPQTELLRQRVRSVGLGLTDRVPGPFALCVARLWATNNPDEATETDPAALREAEENAAAAIGTAETDAGAAASQGQLPKSTAGNTAFSSPSPPPPPPPSSSSPRPRGDEPVVGGLKNKQGRPVRWDTSKQAQQNQQPTNR
ncbi:FAD dependent oxidoreductase superfamily [Niveomyces insectorum RCEF 264]|uniref:FAD dependent oxidoreductase superfamily n=1 Tax=Niveomyces insectorum RCEF 264 TaxID=1081102 RepID=A0A167WAX0_9HYPO|nr:FAD dependent oxidoreductase superfamily [Niveomyces insectorum RCEF 264]